MTPVVPARRAPPTARRVLAYVASDAKVFVKSRNRQDHWIRTDPCVLLVACPACDAGIGEACLGLSQEVSSVHVDRRTAARMEVLR